MVAVFDVYFDFGGTDGTPGTEQDTDALGPPSIRFKQADDATIDSSDPVPIPAAGTNYSYWKHVYLYCATAPDTQVNNVKLYTDGGGFGTGITTYVGDEMPTKNSGSDAGYEVADSAVTMVSNHTGISAQTDLFSYTSGSSKTISISETSSIIDAIGETTNYVVLQVVVVSTASVGDKTDETITYVYDEI